MQKPWVFNIVSKLIFKNTTTKKFYNNISPDDFYFIPHTNIIRFKKDDVDLSILDNKFVLFSSALRFLRYLDTNFDIQLVNKKYEMRDGLDDVYIDGKLFKDDFYNYVYKQYTQCYTR